MCLPIYLNRLITTTAESTSHLNTIHLQELLLFLFLHNPFPFISLNTRSLQNVLIKLDTIPKHSFLEPHPIKRNYEG